MTGLPGSRRVCISYRIGLSSYVGEGGWALPNWVQGNEKHWREVAAEAKQVGKDSEYRQATLHTENASAFGEHLRTLTEQYQISYIELEVLVADTTAFTQHWNDAVDAIESAVKLLRHPQEFGAISSNYLPYVSIIPAFSAIQAHASGLPANRRLEAQRKVRHWYWASVFLNRYSDSVESTAARDFLDMKAWMDDDEREPGLIQEFGMRFRTLELRREVRRGTSRVL